MNYATHTRRVGSARVTFSRGLAGVPALRRARSRALLLARAAVSRPPVSPELSRRRGRPASRRHSRAITAAARLRSMVNGSCGICCMIPGAARMSSTRGAAMMLSRNEASSCTLSARTSFEADIKLRETMATFSDSNSPRQTTHQQHAAKPPDFRRVLDVREESSRARWAPSAHLARAGAAAAPRASRRRSSTPARGLRARDAPRVTSSDAFPPNHHQAAHRVCPAAGYARYPGCIIAQTDGRARPDPTSPPRDHRGMVPERSDRGAARHRHEGP